MNKDELNKNTFDKLAKQYADRFMNYEGYLDTFDLFIDTIKNDNSKILEIACGPGNVTKYLLSKKSSFQIYGIDVAPNMIELARANNPMAKYDIMDCRYLSHTSDRFDAIMCAFGLPYINQNDAVTLIDDCGRILNEDGILYLSTMEGKYSDSEYVESKNHNEKTYVYYHEVAYLKKALMKNHLEIIHEVRQPYQNDAGKEFVDLFLIARKKT